MSSVELLCRVRPDAARVLPALALEGTWSATYFEAGLWDPMSIDEAVVTCKHVVKRLRTAGTEVIRVGLQPAVDLQEAPEIVAGPYDPGLRQRVETELLRSAATEALRRAFTFGVREFLFVVHPRDEAFLRGPENTALRRLKDQFRLDALGVAKSTRTPRGRPIVLPGRPEPDEVALAVGARKAS
jgi:histone acetyltransferase (RNA polymerase elongator complex component)